MPAVHGSRGRAQAQTFLKLDYLGASYNCRLHPYSPVPVAAGVARGFDVIATHRALVYGSSAVFAPNGLITIHEDQVAKTFRIVKDGVQPDTSYIGLLISPEQTRVMP